MSVSGEKTTLQVTFPKEKLEALRFYMNEKELTVEVELQNFMKSIYEKYVPAPTRRYLDRNDNGQEIQAEIAVVTNENVSETTSRNTTIRGRRRAERTQNAEEQATAETINVGEIEDTSGQAQEESQGMVMSM